MKKTTKGALAAGAAAVLLAGGAGTYAAWTASGPEADGGTVTTGHLTVTQKQETTTGWTWAGGVKDGLAVEALDTLAPGDTIAYTGTYVLGIEGTNLTAKVDVTTSGGGAIPDEMTWTPTSSASITDLDEEDNGLEITAGGELAFSDSATGTMDTDVSIGDFQVVLKQTAPAAVDATADPADPTDDQQ